MDIRTKIYSALSTIAAMTAIVACSEIDNVANGQYHGDGRITFSASTVAVDEGTMRAAGAKTQDMTSIAAKTDDGKTLYLHTTVTPIPVDSATHTMRGTKTESVANISDFGVTSFITNGTFASDGASLTNCHFDTDNENKIVQAESPKPTSGTEWNTSTPYYWPDGTAKLSFFAYSPYTSTNPFGISGGKVTLSYTANATVASQEDLLIAAAFDENHSASLDPKQSLTFKHALTAVTFEAAADLFPCTITKVSLSGIPTKNTYTYATAAGALYGTWGTTGSVGSEKTFEFDFTADGDVGKASTEGTLTSGANTLLMVPQTLPSGATATIEFTDAALRKHKLSYSLAGQLWEAGKQVKYTLSSSSITSIQIDFAEKFTLQGGKTELSGVTGLKTSFAANDQIGFYAVDIVNNMVLASNVPIKLSSDDIDEDDPTIATITSLNSSTLAAQAFLSDDTNKYRYFAYYPYQSTAPTTIAASEVTTSTTAEQFFANYISNWTPPADQSAVATINSYDLQVGDVIGAGSSISNKALTIKLRHQMGLAAIAMGASVSGNVETLTLDGNTTTKKYNTTTNTTFYALDEFSDNGSYCTPYKVGDRNTANLRCYFLVNPAKKYTFGTTYKYGTTGQWNDFTVDKDNNTVNAGKYNVVTTSAPKFKNLGRLYSCTQTVQTYTPLYKEIKYQMECWGAEGAGFSNGSYSGKGGYGGYASGILKLTNVDNLLYVYCGSRPINYSLTGYTTGGWNGGGDQTGGASGGGGSDIRFVPCSLTTTWNEIASLRSRIIVAGGGGGWDSHSSGGYGGGLYGGDAVNSTTTAATGGKQNSGGAGSPAGSFGQGGGTSSDAGGGGGGWYGGGKGRNNASAGAGGSGFISGHPYCNGINSSGTHQGDSKPSLIRFPGTTSDVEVSFISGTTVLIDGGCCQWTTSSRGSAKVMPNPTTASSNYASGVGHAGNGYARITCKPYE